MRGADEIGEIRYHPVVAGLDKQVVIERFNVFVDRAKDLLEGREIGEELIRRRLLFVPSAVDLGQALVKRDAFRGGDHLRYWHLA
jgi:hypothetical protein